MNKTPKVSRIKAFTTVFLVVSMSLTILLSLMPTAMAAGERIEGTITDGTDPLEGFDVFIWYEGLVGQRPWNHTDVNGDYGIDLPGAGVYTVEFSNDTWSGQMSEVLIVDAQVLDLDFVAVPDNDPPVMSELSVDNVDGVSVVQPANFNFTIDETYLYNLDVEMYQYTDKHDSTANLSHIKTWKTDPFMSMPGTEVEIIDFKDEGNDINTTGFQFDGTVMGGWVSDGTTDWWITVGDYWENSSRVLAYCYYENDTIGPNNDTMGFVAFNKTTGDFEGIILANESGIWDANHSDPTGFVVFRNNHVEFDWSLGIWDSDEEGTNITTAIDVVDLQANGNLTIDHVLPSGDYLIIYEIEDFGGYSDDDWFNFTIDNDPPVADAGENITIKQGKSLMFNGSASSDNNDIVNYTWNYTLDSTGYDLYDWNATSGVFNDIGLVEVNLTVYDVGGWSAWDLMYVNVTDGIGPVVNPGENITAMQNEEFMFNGSNATDNVDDLENMTFLWFFNDTVENVTLTGWNATHTLTEMGLYNVTLTVTDMADNPTEALTWITITDGIAPVADAGVDITAKQGETVSLIGNASTDIVGIVNYTWAFTENAVNYTLYGDNVDFVFNYMDEYNVTLTVMDDAGLTGEDVAVVTITDGVAPIVNAGADVTAEVNTSVAFNGSASEDNVGIVNYTWDFDDNSTTEGALVNHVFTEVGIYNVTLTCTDANGNVGTGYLIVTIEPVNFAPHISAIAAQTATENAAYTLTVTATDENVEDVLMFTLVEGPTGMVINNTTGVITWTPTSAMVGTSYPVLVEVTDGKLTTNTTFTITVESAIPATITVTIGPIKSDGKALKNAEITLMYQTESVEGGKTDGNGFLTTSVPGTWIDKTINVKVSKDGYKAKTFTGTVDAAGTFTPSGDSYPDIAAKEEGQDFTFLLIVIIVLIVLALVLLSMRKPAEGDVDDEDEDIEDEEEEEGLTEEE